MILVVLANSFFIQSQGVEVNFPERVSGKSGKLTGISIACMTVYA
jgi:hypothetical protein